MDATVAAHARKLLDQHGPHEVWRVAAGAALGAHVAAQGRRLDYWRDVFQVLRRIAPRPGCSDVDVRRSAQMLIRQHGPQEAWRRAMARAAELDGDLVGRWSCCGWRTR